MGLSTIAAKEFTDLIRSRVVVVTFVVYLALVGLVVYSYSHNVTTSGLNPPGERLVTLTFDLVEVLIEYGGVMAVIVGFTSVWNETRNGALGVLMVKPVSRNAVVLGKLIGAMAFMACLSAFASLAFVAGLLMLAGDVAGPTVDAFVGWMPAIFALSMICEAIFVLLAMLFTLLLRDVILALFLSVLSWILLNEFVPNIAFAGNLSLLFGPNQEAADSFLNSLSPVGSVQQIFFYVRDNDDILTTIAGHSGIVIRLAVMLLALLAIDYIVFARRDIA